jgi:solute carrier family 35 protein F5
VNADDSDVIEVPHKQGSRFASRSEALLLLVTVSVIWVAASQLVHSIFTGLHSSLPWSLTYINVAEFAILLPLQWAWERCRGAKAQTDWRGAAEAAAYVAPVWYIAQGTYNASLSGTSVSSATMLSTTSCAFTLVLGLCLGDRPAWRVLVWRVGGVTLVITGAALVSSADATSPTTKGDDTVNVRWGDALALTSAFAYACYTTLISRLVPETPSTEDEAGSPVLAPQGKKRISLLVFFGYIGLFTSISMLPFVLALNGVGLESVGRLLSPVNLPGTTSTPLPILLILAKGLLDNVFSDLLWARAVRLTSATLGTVALSLTIPLAMGCDALFQGRVPTATAAAGGALIMIGFILAAVAEGYGQRKAAAGS